MRSMEVERESPSARSMDRIAALLREGGVVIYPSDTVYGLLCMAENGESVQRLARIKGYDLPRPFILLVSDLGMAASLMSGMDADARRRLSGSWPGPVSFVVEAGPGCPGWVQAEEGTVAVRQPADPLSAGLLERVAAPLVSTSANSRADEVCRRPDDIAPGVLREADLLVDGGELPARPPSTLIRATDGTTLRP